MIALAMPDYTLSELARLADVTPRTIRYYVAQGLLPSPDAAGPATRYGDAHLARLRLIKRLQREHLPLAEIRAQLLAMTDDQIVQAAEATEPKPRLDSDTALSYVRDLMTRVGVAPRYFDRPAAPAAPTAPPAPPPALAMTSAPRIVEPPQDAPQDVPPPPAAPVQPDRSTWERITLDPDVELHVRRPLDRLTNKRVDRLVRIARELFEDDAP